jgi:hypothetical protein
MAFAGDFGLPEGVAEAIPFEREAICRGNALAGRATEAWPVFGGGWGGFRILGGWGSAGGSGEGGESGEGEEGSAVHGKAMEADLV